MGNAHDKQGPDKDECERMVTQYAPMVASIARSLLRKLPPSVMVDDLIQDGLLGLMRAILHSSATHAGRHYNTYLSQRIRGAMLDGLRENDPGSRQVRKEMRRVEAAIHRLSHRLGRAPHENEVAAELAIPLENYQRLLQEAEGYVLFSLEDFDDSDPEKDFMAWCATTNTHPMAALERSEVHRRLLLGISGLTEREENVMSKYYAEGISMRAIGVQLGVSESRISQIHAQAVAKLRAAVLGDENSPSLLTPRWRTD